jgi:Crp-like helix-turn-helix protein
VVHPYAAVAPSSLADAAGLSVVHITRIIHGLRTLGVLSPDSREIEVTDRERLLELANFDAHYLNMPEALSHWRIEVDSLFD